MSGLVDYEFSDNESNNENNESNLLLVDYTTNEEEEMFEKGEEWEENSFGEKVLKRKEIDTLDEEEIVASKKRGSIFKGESPQIDLPPLPSEFLQLYPGKKNYTKHIDDPSKHQGRVRSKPHVEGDWATHVYVEVTITEEVGHIINKIEELTKKIVSEDSIKIISCIENHNRDNNNPSDHNDYYEEAKLHISLSRPLFLKYHQIELFWNKLRKEFLNRKRFTLSFSNITSFSNDDNTRSFMALQVGKGTNELKMMVDSINKVVKDFRQTPFYENPQFHASILWALGESSIDHSLCETIKETEYFESIIQHIFNIGNIFWTAFWTSKWAKWSFLNLEMGKMKKQPLEL
ncbi:hypothetical protein C1645_828401 [Glomus cerebriforme]|uniref:U6 snRNA phosphodiesterase 1 n=1 Tax=Glomus cerebriforme TaxID=658196 RepID=A0A397SLV1_9GLOM|nr:hypothetical protein C1645_828401 [Glomus cerebriforme]